MHCAGRQTSPKHRHHSTLPNKHHSARSPTKLQHICSPPQLAPPGHAPCLQASCQPGLHRWRYTLCCRSTSMDSASQQGPAQQSASTLTSQRQMQGQQHQQQQSQRQHERLPFTLGLTGSIGMGKSTVSGFFRSSGIPVLEADDVVHSLYSAGGAAVAPMAAAFPSAVVDGVVSRPALSACVVGNEAAMKQLEAIVHPLVEAARRQFLQEAAMDGHQLVVFDIPLLYETGAERQLDAVAVVSASAEAQRERVLARPGMTPEKFQAILARQVPDAEKRRRADFVIDTSTSLEQTQAQVNELIQRWKDRKEAALQDVQHGKL